jgi:hypothetical protein
MPHPGSGPAAAGSNRSVMVVVRQLMPVLDHEMVQQNSPGLLALGYATRERAMKGRPMSGAFRRGSADRYHGDNRINNHQKRRSFRGTKHDVTIEAPFGRPFPPSLATAELWRTGRAGFVLGYSQG